MSAAAIHVLPASWADDERVLLPVTDLAAGDAVAERFERRATNANAIVGKLTHRLIHDELDERQRVRIERAKSIARRWYEVEVAKADAVREAMAAVRGER